MMHGREKSDGSEVPKKLPNNAGQPAAEGVEGRDPTKGNSPQQNTPRTQSRRAKKAGVPSALERVRQVARRDKKAKFTALLHHVTLDRLREAYLRLKRRAAPGVDGVTWEQYGEDLEGNLQALHARLHKGAYRAKPSRRVYIPKADGRLRPLGVAALEDKVVQAAVVEVLNAIYESDFLGFSYGFRPGRDPHRAADALVVGIKTKKVSWVLDADIRGFFDAIDHTWMLEFLKHRIADRRVLRLIQKWLSAGVLEKGKWAECEEGTPQGAVISPLLANVYLHYVLDLWVAHWRKTQAGGEVIIVRYADDFVVGFQHQHEAQRFLEDLRARLQKFSLELHPEKTRLIRFGRLAVRNCGADGRRKPETFGFLGFTYISGKTRSGAFQVVRLSDAKRMRAKLAAVRDELKRRRHRPLREQGRWLGSVVRGWFAYHAVPGNSRALDSFRRQVMRHWHTALRHRSQRHRLDWPKMTRLQARWLPRVRILHPWPEQRLGVSHPR